ncbi:sulfatase-like hydrolase/transferase [Thermoleophilum album]|uniref:sulfatase-like hydrolase/transferase n=1 Tax=Thermoleophilum album TaxID=29539 RepID=UPI00237C8633|nr:sulfatase-like hydrolase/transferase [Thermoleophilum album]
MFVLHALTVWMFAVAQPLYQVFADAPDFFVARRNTRLDILLLVILITFAIPTVLALLVDRVGKHFPRARELFLGSIVALIVVQLLRSLPLVPLLAVAAMVATAFARLYRRRAPVRAMLSVLSAGLVVLPLWFVFVSPVSDLIVRSSEARANSRVTVSSPAALRPIVWITFDELDLNLLLDSAGRIDAARFPNFARLARASRWFPNASTVNEWTTQAVPAMLDGKIPRRQLLPHSGDHPNNLFTLLSSLYDVHAFEAVTQLCPVRLCKTRTVSAPHRMWDLVSDSAIIAGHTLLPNDLARRLPAVDQGFSDFGARRRVTARVDLDKLEEGSDPLVVFGRLMRTIERASPRKNAIYFAHLLLPHAPWQFLPDGRTYPGAAIGIPGLNQEQWSRDPGAVLSGMQRHLWQTAYADRLIGKLIDGLRKSGLWERAVLVVTADHGVSFTPGVSRRVPQRENWARIASVPLFVRIPTDRAGTVDRGFARTVDILPTVLEAIGVRSALRIDGRSLLNGAPKDGVIKMPYVSPYSRYQRIVTAVPFREFVAARRRELVQLARITAPGRYDSLYAIGGEGEALLGAPVGTGIGRPLPAVVDYGGELRPVGAGRVKLHGPVVSGQLPGEQAVRVGGVALVADGRVVATAPVARDQGAGRFVLPVPRSIETGAFDTVEVRAIERRTGRLLDEQIPLHRRVEARMVGGQGRKWVRGPGFQVPILPAGSTRGVEGFVDGIQDRNGAGVLLFGWAVETDSGRPVQAIYVFDGTRAVATGKPILRRPDIAKYKRTRVALGSGWSLLLPTRYSPRDLTRLRVVAVGRLAAAVLPLYPPVRERARRESVQR